MAGLFFLAGLVWAAAVAYKAVKALRARADYVFSGWDGGALLTGKRLRGPLVLVKLIGTLAMAGLVVTWLGSFVPFAVGKWGFLGLVLALFVVDVVFAKRE